jgi:hypothetical protein
MEMMRCRRSRIQPQPPTDSIGLGPFDHWRRRQPAGLIDASRWSSPLPWTTIGKQGYERGAHPGSGARYHVRAACQPKHRPADTTLPLRLIESAGSVVRSGIPPGCIVPTRRCPGGRSGEGETATGYRLPTLRVGGVRHPAPADSAARLWRLRSQGFAGSIHSLFRT